MKKTIILIIFLNVFINISCSGSKVNKMQFSNTKFTGLSGQPLGTIITVKGVVQEESLSKADSGKTMLKIFVVNGEKLKNPITLPIQFFPFTQYKVPNAGEDKTYIGYETGQMTGIPDKAFEYIPRVATTGFHFEYIFKVCKDVK